MGQIEGVFGPYLNAGVPANGTDEVQTLTPSAETASGTFKLAFDGYKTAALAYNITAAAMQTALNGLPSIGAGGVAVTLALGVYTVTFSGTNVSKRAQPMLEVLDSTLKDAGGDAVDLVAAEGTAGVTATALGAQKGALIIDTSNGELYINVGTTTAPSWKKMTHA